MSAQLATILRLLRFMAPLNGIMAISVAMRIVHFLGSVALIAVPVAGVASFVRDPSFATAAWVLGLVFAVAAIRATAHYVEQFTGHYVAFRLLAMLRNICYDRLEPLIPADTSELRTGDAIARAVNDCDRIEPFYAHTIAPVITAVVVPAVLATTLWLIHPWFVAAYVPVVVAMVVGLPWLIGRLGGKGSQRWRHLQGEVNAFLTDSLQGLRDTLAFDAGLRRRAAAWRLGEELEAAQARLVRADAVQRAITEVLVWGAALASLGLGVWLTTQGAIDPLLAIPLALAITITGFESVSGFTNVITDYRVSIVAAQRLFALLDREPSIRDRVTAPAVPASPAIEFDHVYFGYRRNGHGTAVLRGVTFKVDPGQHVALVGASGAGKSTIANLVLRFWDPESGDIRLGGVSLRSMPVEQLRSLVSVVSQRDYIFNTTIGDNIRMGKPGATPEEVDEAARRANLLEWIRSLPEGYDTRVGEMGSRLSGGQRQRVAIARALLKDAPILILDEATANLDVETEREVNAAIAELAKGRTVLTIAHRLSTVLTAEEILVLEEGRIVERGTHEALLAAQGVYARIFELQRDEIDDAIAAGAIATVTAG